MTSVKAVLRCVRCGDAYDGPCIDKRDGSVETTHRYVHVEFTTQWHSLEWKFRQL